MIRCNVNAGRGSTSVLGLGIPNGPAVLSRLVAGRDPYVLRGGKFTVTNGGFNREDAEVPFGVPLTYEIAVTPPDRVVQTNPVPTPTFMHGAQTWRAGTGRTLTVTADPTAAHPQVGAVTSNPGGFTTVAPPTLVGTVTTGPSVIGSYALTPTGSAAVGDYMYLIHHQPAGLDRPVVAGFVPMFQNTVGTVDVSVWRRKRTSGDSTYTVVATNSVTLGILAWVRGASDAYPQLVGTAGSDQQLQRLVIPPIPAVARPGLVLVAFAAELTAAATAGTDGLTGTATVVTCDTPTRRTVLGSQPMPDAGRGPTTVVTFPQPALAASGVQILITADAPLTTRTIATVPAGAVPATGIPHLMSGRFKFRTPDLWLWQDVLNQGSWQHLKDTKANWQTVLSSASYAPTDYLQLYVDIVGAPTGSVIPGTSGVWNAYAAHALSTPVDEAAVALAMDVIRTGNPPGFNVASTTKLDSDRNLLLQVLFDLHTTPGRSAMVLSNAALDDPWLAVAVNAASRLGLALTAPDTATTVATTPVYVSPVQVIVADAPRTNDWVDFSFFFTTSRDLPADAIIRFSHGTASREYAVTWQFDQVGITYGADRAAHDVLPFLDGDTPLPGATAAMLLPGGGWSAVTQDATVAWVGTPGASASVLTGPSQVRATTTCQVDVPADVTACAPIYLNDPITPARGQWYSLLSVSDLTYPARRAILDVLGRGPQIAVSQVRAWPSGSLTLLTRTREEREAALSTLRTGRILLYRNPDPAYPEDAWYISIGDVVEARLSGGDHRRPERQWTVPFTQVERPVGLIEQSFGRTWQDVLNTWTDWAGVRRDNATWLDLLYPGDSFVPSTGPLQSGATFPGPLTLPDPALYPGT